MRRGLIIAVAVGAVLTQAGSALGATIRVTTLADDYDSDPLTCSLREAVQAANTDVAFDSCHKGNGADRIVLRSGQSYAFTRAGGDDTNMNGDLDVTTEITIEPNHQDRATIDAAGLGRVLDLADDEGRLELSRLVIRGGNTDAAEGYSGGGIRNYVGRVEVSGSRFVDNHATGAGSSNGGAIATGFGTESFTKLTRTDVKLNTAENVGGGIIWQGGVMKISQSTVAGNQSDSFGGGIYLGGYINPDTDRFRMKASTVSGNHSETKGGGIHVGLFVSDEPQLAKATNVTISGNDADQNGGGISYSAGDFGLNVATVTNNTADADASGDGQGGGISGSGILLRNSIIAENLNPNPVTPILDCHNGGGTDAHNLVGEGGGCFEGGGNTAVADPLLKALGNYGGPTQTHALKPGSKAIGRAGSSAPKHDQRGVKRDGNPDIGAYER